MRPALRQSSHLVLAGQREAGEATPQRGDRAGKVFLHRGARASRGAEQRAGALRRARGVAACEPLGAGWARAVPMRARPARKLGRRFSSFRGVRGDTRGGGRSPAALGWSVTSPGARARAISAAWRAWESQGGGGGGKRSRRRRGAASPASRAERQAAIRPRRAPPASHRRARSAPAVGGAPRFCFRAAPLPLRIADPLPLSR